MILVLVEFILGVLWICWLGGEALLLFLLGVCLHFGGLVFCLLGWHSLVTRPPFCWPWLRLGVAWGGGHLVSLGHILFSLACLG